MRLAVQAWSVFYLLPTLCGPLKTLWLFFLRYVELRKKLWSMVVQRVSIIGHHCWVQVTTLQNIHILNSQLVIYLIKCQALKFWSYCLGEFQKIPCPFSFAWYGRHFLASLLDLNGVFSMHHNAMHTSHVTRHIWARLSVLSLFMD